MSIARWNLKEAAGKALARRIETVYKAAVMGEEANIFKAQYLYGNHGCKCGGYKCEGGLVADFVCCSPRHPGCALPGEVCRKRHFRKVDNRCRKASLSRQKSADDIVGGFDPTEGRNMKTRMRSFTFDAE